MSILSWSEEFIELRDKSNYLVSTVCKVLKDSGYEGNIDRELTHKELELITPIVLEYIK